MDVELTFCAGRLSSDESHQSPLATHWRGIESRQLHLREVAMDGTERRLCLWTVGTSEGTS